MWYVKGSESSLSSSVSSSRALRALWIEPSITKRTSKADARRRRRRRREQPSSKKKLCVKMMISEEEEEEEEIHVCRHLNLSDSGMVTG